LGHRKSFIGFIENINERKESELKLKRSEAQLQLIAENLADIVAEIDSDGRIVFINKATRNVLGFSPEELIGEYFWSVAESDQAELIFDLFKNSKINHTSVNGEFCASAKNGKEVWLEGLGRPFFNSQNEYSGGVISARDITERKLSEQAIAESESKYRNLFETSPDGIALVSLAGAPLNCNPKMLEISGTDSVEEFCSYDAIQFIFPEYWENRVNFWRDLLSNGYFNSFEMPVSPKSKAETFVEVFAKVIEIDNTPKWVLLILKDITERRKAEQKLQTSFETLKELNSTKDKFFSIISHDLKNPISAFLNLTSMLKNEIGDLTITEINELTHDMNQAADNLYKLLENLLAWSRSQTGRIQYSPDRVDIRYVTDNVVSIFSQSAQNKAINLSAQIDEDLFAYADLQMFHTVLRNLVSNAIKFTPRGGEIVVSAEQTGEDILVRVKDSGVGMSHESVGKLFRIECSSSTKGTDDESGTGLGLILCREFVEKNKGTISVESKLGKGTTLSFTLPQFK
jgi:PAS domain S-box-containing protein